MTQGKECEVTQVRAHEDDAGSGQQVKVHIVFSLNNNNKRRVTPVKAGT